MRFKGTQFNSITIKALLLLLVLTPLHVTAETLFVSDTLRVGIRTLPNSNVPSIAVVKSGVAVEVLKRKGSYIQVRTTSGVEGWVKGAYFSKKPPTANKLNKALGKIAALEKEIKSLNKQKKTSPTKITPDLSGKIKELQSNNQTLKNEIQSLKNNSVNTVTTDDIFSFKNINKNILYYALGGLVVLLCLGFLFGVSWHKGQVTKRLGGMSI